ncbi:hypothetical protein BpHYR1_049652 [Brachionus plicatilis]|uniref:Uncharacterized protein n=1 Tax=Brachionus plicatilis TaxID=10195 RepID=A0A3M7R597_BRAPC|nr:hypothetical protein BpHYR1_049652 [Brachionus plicatilis]
MGICHFYDLYQYSIVDKLDLVNHSPHILRTILVLFYSSSILVVNNWLVLVYLAMANVERCDPAVYRQQWEYYYSVYILVDRFEPSLYLMGFVLMIYTGEYLVLKPRVYVRPCTKYPTHGIKACVAKQGDTLVSKEFLIKAMVDRRLFLFTVAGFIFKLLSMLFMAYSALLAIPLDGFDGMKNLTELSLLAMFFWNKPALNSFSKLYSLILNFLFVGELDAVVEFRCLLM